MFMYILYANTHLSHCLHRDGRMAIKCGQSVGGDVLVILASPQSETTSVPICQLQVWSS